MKRSAIHEDRISALLAEMTIEEKAGQCNQMTRPQLSDADIADGKAGSIILAGSAYAGNEKAVANPPDYVNAIQEIAVKKSRLGIPIVFGRDVIHGHRTVFPIPLAQSFTWNPELVKRGMQIAALEARNESVHWTFTPMLDIARDPRWGRIAEGYGEDPWLCASLGSAAIVGLQGKGLSSGQAMAACVKHFCGYGWAEGGRDYNTTDMSDATLRDVVLPGFKAAIDAGAATVMSAFNEIGGVPMTASYHLLTNVLKNEWGFEGFIVTDWDAVNELIQHGVAADGADAARMALMAGIDMDMVSGLFLKHLPTMAREDSAVAARLDDAVLRVLRVKAHLGLFDAPYFPLDKASVTIRLPESLDAAQACAEESFVLLENRGILPLKADATCILAGPLVDATDELFGTWCLDGQDDEVQSPRDWIKETCPAMTLVDADYLCPADLPGPALDVETVVFIGGEHPRQSGEGNSLADIVLAKDQLVFLREMKQLGKKIVTVIIAGRPLVVAELAELSDALLFAGHPGSMGGKALARILSGQVSPSGRLSVSFPRATGQIPIYYNKKNTGRPYTWSGAKGNYNDLSNGPLYPFGYGLTYSKFSYDALQSAPLPSGVTVSARVTNTGPVAASEVVQLYVRDLVGSRTRPIRELKGFQKVALAAGDSATVRFTVNADDLSFWRLDSTMSWEPGRFKVWIGPHCEQGLEGDFELCRP